MSRKAVLVLAIALLILGVISWGSAYFSLCVILPTEKQLAETVEATIHTRETAATRAAAHATLAAQHYRNAAQTYDRIAQINEGPIATYDVWEAEASRYRWLASIKENEASYHEAEAFLVDETLVVSYRESAQAALMSGLIMGITGTLEALGGAVLLVLALRHPA